jgi:hypothetical protein
MYQLASLRGHGSLLGESVVAFKHIAGKITPPGPEADLSGGPLTKRLSEEIIGTQNYGSVGLSLLFEELTRCSLFNYIAQLHKLMYPLFWLHVTPTLKVVHCRRADRAQDHFALIEHRELNDHPIEVVILNVASLKRHRKRFMSSEFIVIERSMPV